MKKQMMIATAVLTAGIGAAGITTAIAGNGNEGSDTAEIQALLATKYSASDAIKAAEAVQAGKVAEVQFETEKGAPAYEISIVSADGVEHGFMVDANSGSVTKRADNGDQSGEDRENGHEDNENDND